MSRSAAQPVSGAPTFLDLRELVSSPQDFVDAWRGEKRPTLALRALMEVKSDYSFADDLIREAGDWFDGQGLARALGYDVIGQLLCAPTFARSAEVRGTSVAWHAVVLSRTEDGALPYELLVKVRATVQKRHFPKGESVAVPAAVIGYQLHLEFVDLQDEADLGAVMQHYIGMVADLGPLRSARTLPFNVLILGNPHELGCADTPANWQEQLTFLAQAFDADITFERGPTVTGVPKNLMCLIRFDPFAGKLPKKLEGDGTEGEEEIEHTPIEARFTSFADAFHQICVVLNAFEPPPAADEYAPRELKPGEKVYHRKVGNAVGYDRFNAGSSESCQHTSAYVRYYNSDKAVKGFRRRYTNFEASWMHHCKQSACGMYAVFCPGDAA